MTIDQQRKYIGNVMVSQQFLTFQEIIHNTFQEIQYKRFQEITEIYKRYIRDIRDFKR